MKKNTCLLITLALPSFKPYLHIQLWDTILRNDAILGSKNLCIPVQNHEREEQHNFLNRNFPISQNRFPKLGADGWKCKPGFIDPVIFGDFENFIMEAVRGQIF